MSRIMNYFIRKVPEIRDAAHRLVMNMVDVIDFLPPPVVFKLIACRRGQTTFKMYQMSFPF